MKTLEQSISGLLADIPSPFAEAAKQIYEGEKAALGDYLLVVSHMDADYVVETRSFMTKRLRELIARAPKNFRDEYEKLAAEQLKQYDDIKVGERVLWCWPGSEAAKGKIRELVGKTGSMKPVERQTMLWKFADLAQACGLGDGLVSGGKKGLTRAAPPDHMPSGAGKALEEKKNEDPDMVRLALPQKGRVKDTAHLLFVGGRKRRAYGNRFTVTCWDMKVNKRAWVSREILLGGKVAGQEAYEVGFEEIFLHGELAIVHGQYDVIALSCDPGADLDQRGKKDSRWHFRAPLGFEIKSVELCGDVLVLCGRGSTVAISPLTGEILWDAAEMGEFYAGPFFHGDVVLTVRKSPSEVSFRKVGSGRLLSRLSIPGLSTNRKHPMFTLEGMGGNPAAAEAAEAYPVACRQGTLALTDGLTYHVVDLEKRKLRWSCGASKLDRSRDAAYRMWIDGGRLFVLKPYYAVLENAVFDLASGAMVWRRREGGKKMDTMLKKYADQDAEEGGRAATGLVLTSMQFIGGEVYGIKYQMGGTSVVLVGMDPASGNEIMNVGEKGFSDPEAYVEPSWSAGCVNVRIQDGNRFELWQVDVKAKKIVQRLKLEGYGRLGEYGDCSMAWQGPYHAIWAFDKRILTTSN
jgi:hypothetical protein